MMPGLRAWLLTALALAGCSRHTPAPAAGPPEVLITAVRLETGIPVVKEWVGTLKGSTESDVRARVQGYIQTQVYANGTLLKTGDVLFQIDPRPFIAALEQAKANLADMQAQKVQTGLEAIRKAELLKDGAISVAENDKAVQMDSSALANVQAAEAALQEAQLNLGYAQVVAPIDGIAGIAEVNVGDLVGPGTGNLVSMATLDPIKAIFYLSEQEYLESSEMINAFAAGHPLTNNLSVQLVLWDGTLYPYTGAVSSVNLQINEQTGTIEVETLFPNPGNKLRPGLYALVRITSCVNALVVPQRAVMTIQGKNVVVVVGPDNTAVPRPVTVGERFGQNWAIANGLKAGERVVVEGLQKVKAGAPVLPKPYVPPAVPASQPSEAPAAPPAAAPTR
jgi:membrane fusion protein (multidrug efflux system)